MFTRSVCHCRPDPSGGPWTCAALALLALLRIPYTVVAGNSGDNAPQTSSTRVQESAAVSKLFLGQPTIMRNSNRRVPLVALIDFESPVGVIATLEITDGEHAWRQNCDTHLRPGETVQRIAVLGMRAARKHTIRLRLENPVDGTFELSRPLIFTTPPLPKNFPPIAARISRSHKMEPGVTLFSANLWLKDKGVMGYGFLTAIDSAGEVVWYLKTGHRTADIRILKNGHIAYLHANYRHALEIDLLGNIVRQWHGARLTKAPHEKSIAVDVDTMHHELLELPGGNFLTLATELKRFDSYPTSETDPDAPWEPAWGVVDEIVEFEPDSGRVVARFPLFDLLDKNRFGYLALTDFWKSKYDEKIGVKSRDWSHANAVFHDPRDNSLVVSLRHLDCLIKIDRITGDIRWIMGDHGNWGARWQQYLLQPKGVMEWHYHQHTPQLTPAGTILMYDNGNFRALPYESAMPASENQSRAVEFRVDEQQRTVEQVWEYRGLPDDEFFCPFYCEADLLPRTGNILVTDGGHIELSDGTPDGKVPSEHQWARIFEITRTDPPVKVFEVVCDSGLGSPLGWSIYRSVRLQSLDALRPEFDLLHHTHWNQAHIGVTD